jgi:hypothetical protein
MTIKSIAIPAVMLVASAYCGQAAPKFKIQVVDNSSDPVGQRLVYQLKEKIRGSHSMELIPNCDNGCWRIIVHTLDKEPDGSALKANATIFSVVWLGVPESQPNTEFFLIPQLVIVAANESWKPPKISSPRQIGCLAK